MIYIEVLLSGSTFLRIRGYQAIKSSAHQQLPYTFIYIFMLLIYLRKKLNYDIINVYIRNVINGDNVFRKSKRRRYDNV